MQWSRQGKEKNTSPNRSHLGIRWSRKHRHMGFEPRWERIYQFWVPLFTAGKAKPCGKRLLLSPKKSSGGTSYNVPGFGGHIAISHDVTTYPFVVMARTGQGSKIFSILRQSAEWWKCRRRVTPDRDRSIRLCAYTHLALLSSIMYSDFYRRERERS